jgi:hypothetical protein
VSYINITNVSKQAIPIDVKPEGGDFYRDGRQIHLQGGKSITLPASYVSMGQLENLKLRQQLRVVHVA